MNKILLVFGKEMLVMRRDRRLVISVFVISLVVMPLLMGFIGNIDRLTGAEAVDVPVVVQFDDPVLEAVLADVEGIEVVRTGFSPGEGGYILIIKMGTAYQIHGDRTDDLIQTAGDRLEAALIAYREDLVVERVMAAGLSAELLSPYEVAVVNTADAEKVGGYILSVLVPYLAIILLVSNASRALYVAVGEKEYNTLGALLVANVPRHAIVIGKILAITVFAVTASVLLVVGMLLFANLGFSLAEEDQGIAYALSWTQIGELVALLGALSLLIAALIMLLGTYARNAREAGVYTTPVLFISIFLAVFSFSSTDFGVMAYLTPILGNALAMRDAFLELLRISDLLLVIASNTVLFVLLVAMTVRLYRRESVLFRA